MLTLTPANPFHGFAEGSFPAASVDALTKIWRFGVLRDNQAGAIVMRPSVWIAAVVIFGCLVLCGGWFLRQRARNRDSRPNQDEAMRRHVNKNYD
jgi:hypothetical protein